MKNNYIYIQHLNAKLAFNRIPSSCDKHINTVKLRSPRLSLEHVSSVPGLYWKPSYY